MGMRTIWATCGCLCNAEKTYLAFDAYAWNGKHPHYCHQQWLNNLPILFDIGSSEAMNPYLPEFKTLHDLAESCLVAVSVN